MTHHAIHYTPRAEVSFTRDELILMLECSTHYYDGVCRDYSVERDAATGRPGFICGMMNAMKGGFNDPHRLSFREIDTLAKVVEMGRHLEVEKATLAFGLGLALKRVLIELNESGVEPKVMS